MKKLFWYIVCILLWYNVASANTDFLQLLESKGIDTQILLNSSTVQRGEVTNLLNIVDCQDCYRPTKEMTSSLMQSWRNIFRTYPWNNFDDVSYDTSIVNTNEYYCIAYVGNKWYMNWFPRSTSPVCSWKFCSKNNITNADVIQTVFNITAKIFYSQYKANWSQISTRLIAQPTETQKYFWLEDIAVIENGKKQCVSWSCAIDSTDALQTYVKYCTYESTACGMQEFPFAKQWKRPIAEMNILVQQGIFTTDDMQNLNIEDFAKGAFILDILWRVKERAQCIDNDDQDSDGVNDYNDNCYATYNPRQLDTDQDKIGDVCDNDLDNDWVKNPIWIIDDGWNIVFDSIQNDTNLLSEVLGLSIQQSLITWDEYSFIAKYIWRLKDFTWDFGDNTSKKWIDVSHLYTKPWVYIVRLTAKDSKGAILEAVSSLTVWISKEAISLSIKQIKNTWNAYNFSPIVEWKLTDYVWEYGDGETGKWELVSHTYTKDWTYTVRLTAKDTAWKKIIATSIVVVWWSNQLALTIKQIKDSWNTYNSSPIVVWKLTDYVWDYGDGETGKWELVSHTYTKSWTYTVRLTAKDVAWKTITATSQIIVWLQPVWWVRASLIPSKLVQNIWENTSYTIILEWVNISDVDYVKLSLWDWRTKELRWSDVGKFIESYKAAGKYLIEGTVYLKDNIKLPLAAFITVLPANVSTKDTIDNCLFIVNKDQLDDDKNNVWNACDITERVGISITPRLILQNRYAFIAQYSGSLKDFVWFFGDRTTWSWETTLHTYRDDGLYTVRVEATTTKGKIVSATTTVSIWWPRVALVPAKLVQNVWEKVQYTLQLSNLQISDIDYVHIQRWDGRTRQIRWQEISKFIDSYNTYWGYWIWWTVYLNNNSTLAVWSYVTVVWQNYCLGNIAWSWGGNCDMDKDTIPDMCDTDIDWDSVVNPLWLIRFQNSSCTYDWTNVITNIIKPISWTSTQNTTDNCPFVANPDQAPCKALVKDTDGDGILDIDDVCPAIPELFNGIEDTDWCPEYNFIVSFPSTKVQPWSCNVCPCQYAQNDSAIAPWDRVKAILYDNFTQKPVAESTWYIVP